MFSHPLFLSFLLSTVAATNLTFGLDLNASLSQTATNGLSQIGTLQAPTLPNYINTSLPAGTYPWGDRNAYSTNPYTQSPTTGRTVYYDFTIKRGVSAPDGYQKDVLLINDQFPGPIIEANWGDMVQVTVHNDIIGPEEGTALHWHGLLQTENPWEDGVPSVQQCPIAPGNSLQYNFKADLFGTSWYHSHYSAQYAGGLVGPMIIYGPNNVAYDIDVGPILLTDYYHKQYYDILEEVMGTDLTLNKPNPDNNLINGKMNFVCPTNDTGSPPCTDNAGLSRFRFQTGKKHRLRLINAGASGTQKFSIDGHKMTVMANDFVPIQPYETDIVTLGIGQMTDVIVEATGNDGDTYWMRSTISACPVPSQLLSFAVIYYPDAPYDQKPTTAAWPDTTAPCANDALNLTVPFKVIAPDSNPATTIVLDIGTFTNGTAAEKNQHFLWTVNNSSFRADYNSPLLLLAKAGNTSYPYSPEWNVYDTGSNSTIRLIVRNPTPVAHPMHLHGHNMYVLSEGTGEWDNSIVNAQNPQRRDVQLLRPNGYMVV